MQWLEQVTHHSACGHDASAHGDALHRAPGDQPSHVGRQRTSDRGQRVSAHAPQQDGAAAKAVGQRSPDELRQAKCQQQRREGELGLTHARAKALGDGGQGGQIQVGGDGLQAEQQRQDEDDQFLRHAVFEADSEAMLTGSDVVVVSAGSASVGAGTRLPSYSLRSPNRAVRAPAPTLALWIFNTAGVFEKETTAVEAGEHAARRSRFGERSEYERDRAAGAADSDSN